MNFIFYHIESKWNLDGNFSILNCRFKAYVNCIHKVSDLGSWFSSPSIPFGPLVSRRQTTPSHSPENESSPISPEVATPLSSWVGLRTTIFSSLQSRGFISWMIVTKIHRPCLYYLLSLVTLSLFHLLYPLSFIINLFWQFLKRLEFARCARNLQFPNFDRLCIFKVFSKKFLLNEFYCKISLSYFTIFFRFFFFFLIVEGG